MRVVRESAELASAIRASRSEGQSSFGDPAVFIEKYLMRPRHIEMQILADATGHTLYLGERECSLQRRHQKVVEEAPSPVMTAELRQRMGEAAVALARGCRYRNAGTAEFLVDADRNFFFLEINARLQVEHPVTELITGIDLVKSQIRIAAGEPLSLRQEEVERRGHAIECRIYAEDPDAGFIPSPGRITALRVPGGPGVRDDGAAETGGEVTVFYDSMISKLIAWGDDRQHAVARMRRALDEYEVRGIRTTVPFFAWLLAEPAFAQAAFHTGYLDEVLQLRQGRPFAAADASLEQVALVAAAVALGSTASGAGSSTRQPRAPGCTPGAWGEAAGARPDSAAEGWRRRGRLDSLRH
jgi:acetyl-CoA carboxylase biotin carboxylase subunit